MITATEIREPGWRHSFAWLALAALLLQSAVAFPAPSYVFFFQVRGAWTVLCGRDELSEQKVCELSAPPEELGVKKNIIEVAETAPDAFVVQVRVLDPVGEDTTVMLQVDTGPAFAAEIARGVAAWPGKESRAIVDAMLGGSTVEYTVITAEGKPHTMTVPLSEFREALEAYRQVIRVHGLI